MRCLVNKNILLISPQPWDHIFISKHHYAEELIKNNNRVFFLEPPSDDSTIGIRIRRHEKLHKLFIVTWRPFFPRSLRFHFYSLYLFLMNFQVGLIKKKIDVPLDIVWSFDFNLFPDLRVFDSKLRIFHPVDPLSNSRQVDIGLSANMIISVSKKILDNFNEKKFLGKTLLINHGLGSAFSDLASTPNSSHEKSVKLINVGYFGNMDRKIINLPIWGEIVSRNSDIKFNFWGPYELGKPFHNMMKEFSNVILHGKKNKQDLSREASMMDCFLLIYSEDNLESDRSNSHKIIEYLATGKVVISSRVEAYIEHKNLVIMPKNGDDKIIPSIFLETMNRLDEFNSPKLMRSRKAYARRFTYRDNLEKIDSWISDNDMFHF